MCDWTINWGDVPTWIGAIGALAAVFWAVFLYRTSLVDQRRSQARLLAPVGGAVPVQEGAGELVRSPAIGDSHLMAYSGGKLALAKDAVWAQVRLVSTSDEAFSGLRVWLVQKDGSAVNFPLGFSEMGPHEARDQRVYYEVGTIAGEMRVRLQFQDANGRWWERVNGEPVRELKSPTPTPARDA